MTTLTEHVEQLLEKVKQHETGKDATLFVMAIDHETGDSSTNFYGRPEFPPILSAFEQLKYRICGQHILEDNFVPFGEEI